jgi:hypothetical protein
MANVKKESTSNGGGMVSGLLLLHVLVLCCNLKFIMVILRILKEEI